MLSRPKVAMMCGLPGSGKTSLTRRLETDLPAIRLDLDYWTIALFGQELPPAELHERLLQLKELLWGVARQTVKLGGNVVLDFGFWKRAERIEFAEKIRAAGGYPQLYYLDAPIDTLRERLSKRNDEGRFGTYEITDEMLDIFLGRFEPPTADEGIENVYS